MEKSRLVRNSDWTTDLTASKSESEVEGQGTFVKRKKPEKKKKRNSGAFETNDRKTLLRSRENDLERENESDVKERTSSIVDNKKQFPRSENVKSIELDDLEKIAPKAVDVVVDVHRYYEERVSIKSPKNSNIEILDSKPVEVSEGENIFSRTFVKKESNDKRKKKISGPNKNDFLLQESLDSIEELDSQSKREDDDDERTFTSIESARSLQNDTDEKPRRRKQWEAAPLTVDHQVSNLKKPPRKRWSKDTCVIRLPETVENNSSSNHNTSRSSGSSKMPVPVPRSSTINQNAVFAFDNEAFVSENEEVLRIETDHVREDTRIELRRMSDRTDTQSSSRDSKRSDVSRGMPRTNLKKEHRVNDDTGVETPSSSRDSRRSDVLHKMSRTNVKQENYARGDTRIETRRMSDRTDTPSSSRDSRRSDVLHRTSRATVKKETSSTIENTEDSEVNGSPSTIKKASRLSRRRRETSPDSNLSNSLEEIASNRSRLPHSEDELITDDRRKAWKKQKKIERYSSRENLSTNEEEESSSRVSTGRTDRRSSNERFFSGSKTKGKDRRSIDETHAAVIEEDTKKKKKKKKKKTNEPIKYILVTIHKADMLETDYVTKHPMVKVHIVEEATGYYLKCKRDAGSAYLQPMITGKFDFKENRSMIPIWEEELIFEHDFKAITKSGNGRVILFFEIVDLLSFAEASCNYDRFGNEGCWYKIAWAFLRTVGTNNVMHVDKKVRLQLYRPQKSVRTFGSRTCEVYNWWKSNKREKYPSSLYITVTSIDPPKLEPIIYQQLSLDDILETGTETQKLSAQSSELINLPRWTRLAAQSCKIPNEKYFETEITENGCFFLAFSNDGKYLACVLSEEYDYPIVVYEIESTKIHVRFSGHKTFVYALNWTQDDHYLLSVSSDQTARIWDVYNKIVQHVQMLPHPSYVYCGKFSLRNSSTIATGCYDRVARIWAKDSKSKNYELSQELEAHEGFVNSLCFQKNGNLLTADSVGVIILWSARKNRRMPSKKEWHLSKKIKVREIEGITINAIILHPLESRLLVHSRDNGLRMIDLAVGVVLQKYEGLKNQRIQSTACISPCGGLIFCGGEDSAVNVWNLETGRYLARYTIERTFRAITCVDYHPYDHVFAFSTFGSPAPARILKFDKNSTGKDVGLQMMTEFETAADDHRNDFSSSLPNVSLNKRSRSMSSSGRRQETTNDEELNGFRSARSRTSTIINIFQETEENTRYEHAKLKLRQLKETEQQLKSRSTSRLYNIIEKIDRILSNTSRSSNDVESGHSFVSRDQERDKSRVLTDFNETDNKREKIKSRKSRLARNVDRSSSYVDSSSTSYDGKQVMELKTFHVLKENEAGRDQRRSRSAKTARSSKILQDNTPTTFSDGMANCRKSRERRKGISNTVESTFIRGDRSDPPDSVMVREVQGPKINSSSSPESSGTYVVEKADFERNNDLNSVKPLENERSVNDREMNLIKTVGSDSSLLSNATFTIENEIPIPKPRRNKLVS
ncbi:hypothetical protein KPH14_002522 [Odynerus spinipes]|uniref:Jouberin n=1 Tax=Odynerus spinipes TaxID=1348599 RepID=A0AAD9VSX3_9HYME|nr:hypothetical protein KPH14_002522 [Odynerus spinipes]